MGFIRKTLFGVIFIFLATYILHEYSPNLIMPIMKIPSVKYSVHFIHHFLNNFMFCEESVEDPFTNDMENEKVKGSSVKKKQKFEEKIFTEKELKNYNGKETSKGIYLSILGQVFDVQKGKQYYGQNGGYEFFAGRDGSRAFVTGDFTEEGLIDDITGLTSQDYIGLDEWVQFYKKDYKYVGKLIGRYYNERGIPTDYHAMTMGWIAEAYSHKEAESSEKKLFPPCNSEWYPETGSRVYCTKKSGGIERNWVGVPRKFFTPGKTKPRCACVKNYGPPSSDPHKSPHSDRGDLDNPNLKEIVGCAPNAASCHVIEEKHP